MRGVLEPLGVEALELEPDKQDFKIKYDPSKNSLESILAALKAGGEAAKKLD